MALLRAALKGIARSIQQKRADGSLATVCRGIYDGIVEVQADLLDGRCTEAEPGSIMLCLENSKFYVKGGNGTWTILTI